MKRLGVWIWALGLIVLAAGNVAAAAGHPHSSEEQQNIELLLGFDQIPLEKSQGLFSGLGDSIASWLSGAFWGTLQRFSLARHAFYSAAVDHITGAVDRILPPSASLRFRTSLGGYGASEPSSIPEPPTISSKSGLRLNLLAIWRQVLQDYHSTPVESPPPGASCHNVASQQLHSLRKMLKSQLKTSLCGFKFNRGCTHKFCKLLNHDSKAAVDKVFDILGVNPHEVVLVHVANSLACAHSAQNNEMIQEAQETLPMASSFLDPESYATRMMRLATSPSRLFMRLYSARPRPTFYYRRAMIFRDAMEPQISLEFYVFRSGAESNVNGEQLLPGAGMMHSVPLLPEGFLKHQEPEKNPEDSSLIKMKTGNGGAAAF